VQAREKKSEKTEHAAKADELRQMEKLRSGVMARVKTRKRKIQSPVAC